MVRTMKGHEEPNLSVAHPLSDAVPGASLYACNEGAVVYDAVEDLPDGLGGCVHDAMLRGGALACAAAHVAGGARGLVTEGVRLLSVCRTASERGAWWGYECSVGRPYYEERQTRGG